MMKYEDMLKKAMKQVPEKLKKDERFEIPKLNSRIEGNRTFVSNFIDASKTINRDPKHLLKYIAKELGTQGMIENNIAVFSGKFGYNIVNQKLERYVKDFVICTQCHKPDTKLIKEGRIMFLKCEACGARANV